MTSQFPCTKCGACCRNVHRAKETQYLDRGDGTCRYYNDVTHLCNTYDNRPSICNIEQQYHLNYQQQYTWQEFINLNREACLILETL